MAGLTDENLVLTPTLLRRFKAEAEFEGGDGRYYALIRRANGELLADHPEGPSPTPEQLLFATDALRALNREVHHDGAWVIVYTHPKPPRVEVVLYDTSKHIDYARYALLWMDKDGDVQFTLEWRENESDMVDFPDVLLAGIESLMDRAEGAWNIWHYQMRTVLDPREDQLVKRAQGQQYAH